MENQDDDTSIHVLPDSIEIGDFAVVNGCLRASVSMVPGARKAGKEYRRSEALDLFVETYGDEIGVDRVLTYSARTVISGLNGTSGQMNMITLGIDLASRPEKTAACRLNWQKNEATVELLDLDITDEILLKLARTVRKAGGKVGIDAPFGWPEAFVRAVTAHHSQQAWSPALWNDALREDLRLRKTDVLVWPMIRKQPQSVSTSWIGVPALRMATLMVKLSEEGYQVDRTGAGVFVEVYPAAALRRWGIFTICGSPSKL